MKRQPKRNKRASLTKAASAALLTAAALLASTAPAFAQDPGTVITVESDPVALVEALIGDSPFVSIVDGSVEIFGPNPGSGVYVSGPQGIRDGFALSTGNVVDMTYAPSQYTASTNLGGAGHPLCEGVTGTSSNNDATVLSFQFELLDGADGVQFDHLVGTNEFPTFVGTGFNDGFGLYINGTNVALSVDGTPVTVNEFFANTAQVITWADGNETNFNGTSGVFTSRVALAPGIHEVALVVCDASDAILDTGAFVAAFSSCAGDCDTTSLCNDGVLQPGEVCDGELIDPAFADCPTGYSGAPLCNNDPANAAGDGSCSLDPIPAGCEPIDFCEDVDPDVCGVGGDCESTGPGTYICDCDAGYTFEDGTCEEINICEEDDQVCGEGDCVFEGPGDYSCDCDAGYEFDGFTCTEINVCDDNPAVCGEGSCVFTGPGTYNCLCDGGYSFDGTTCILSVTLDVPADGLLTNNPRPAFEGTGEPGATITISVNGTTVDNTVVEGDGSWSWTPGSDLPEGVVTVVVTDGVSDDDVTITVDTIPPAVAILEPGDGQVLEASPAIFAGEAEANATVEVFLGGVSQGTTTADGGGSWQVAVASTLGNGTYVLVAQATDAAGNTAQDTATFIVDTTADLVIDQPSAGERVRTATPTVTGTAEPGNDVDIFVNGTYVDTVTADGGGNWTWTATDEIADGGVTVTAETDSPSGTRSTSVTFEVDTSTTQVTIDEPSSGDLLNDAQPTVSGMAAPGATVTVSLNGTPVDTVTADGDGDWTWTPSSDLPEGDNTVTAAANDDGVVTEASVTFTVDTIPPAVEILAPGDGDVLSESPLVFVGEAEANTTIELFLDGEPYGTATADGDGNWEVTVTAALDDGTYVLLAQATDAAGNTADDTVTFIVDTTADLIITQPTEDQRVRTATPTVTGTAEPGNDVDIFVNGTYVDTVTADGEGDWSWTATDALADGEVTVTAETDSPSGTRDTSVTFTVDTTTTAVSIDYPADDDEINDPTPTFTGTAEPGAEITILIDGVVVGTETADENGDWSWTPETDLPEGENTVTVVADDDGIVTEATVTFTIDTIPPTIEIREPGDGDVLTESPLVFAGDAEAEVQIDLYLDGEFYGATTADENGEWEFELIEDLADGTYVLVARATDSAGNQSEDTVTFIVDTTAELFITQPTEGDRVRTATPTISGTAEPGNEVDIYLDGVFVDTVTADEDGEWSYTFTDEIVDGQVTVTAETDSPSGLQEVSVTFEVDTTTTTVTIDSPGPGDLINDSQPTISGTAEPGAEVTIILNGNEVATVTADENGNWSWTPDSSLPQGENTVTAVADDDGIETEATVTFEVDTVPPSLVVSSPQADEELPQSGNVVTGTSEPGAVIEVIVDGESIGSTTADENGDWSVPLPDDLEPGEHDLRVTATDAAGNVSVVERGFVIEDDEDEDPVDPGDPVDPDPDEEDRIGIIAGGGACSTTSGADPTLLGFFVFLGLLALRRRREEKL